jgi:excisionase family DNA binding protein
VDDSVAKRTRRTQFGPDFGCQAEQKIAWRLCDCVSEAIVSILIVQETSKTIFLGVVVTHFSPKQAAAALGVSESSVKRWCDLGNVPVIRTAGGHRRIPRQSLEKLLAQGSIIEALESAVDGGTDPALKISFESLENHRQQFLQALQAGDEVRCRGLIHALVDAGFTRWLAADSLITDAMHCFGHLWEQGDLAVYQERRACGICLGLLHELRQAVAVPGGALTAIGGAPRGDVYQLPSQLVELALCESGWKATSLGCNLPFPAFAEAVAEYRPRLVWISLSVIEMEDVFVTEFNQLAESLPAETALIVGGRGATDSLRPKLRYSAHCDSLKHMIDLAQVFSASKK